MEKKKKIVRMLALLISINLLCILAILLINIPKNKFNNKKVNYSISSSNSSVDVEITKTGAWSKEHGIPNFSNGLIQNSYSNGGGQTYSVVVKNKEEYQISYWELEIEIPEDGYINKAWNGEVEVSQFKGEYQHLNLMDKNVDTKGLVYKVLDGEILIPVEKGDKFKYIPSSTKKEYPIGASDPNLEYTSSEIGFIFYYYGELSPEFTNATITIQFKRSISSYAIFWILLGLSIILDFALAFGFGFAIKASSEEKRIKADEKIINESMNTFVDFIDSKDAYTNGHSRRVAQYSKEIAKKCGKNTSEQEYIYRVALMHDCGKIGIPDGILNKNGKLTDEEYDIIRTHTEIGAHILKKFTSIPNIAAGALYHHERYDGTGYPNGLKGTDIPEVARIISVADALDAMNSVRCYRDKMSYEEIISELTQKQGSQFDPVFAQALLELIDEEIVKIK